MPIPDGSPRSVRSLRLTVPANLRHALRSVLRSPVFAATTVLSIAVGVAGAATIFSVVDALLLRPGQGIREAGRVVDIARTTNGSGYGTLSYPVFQHLRTHTRALTSMAATTMDPSPLSLRDDTGSMRVFGRTVSANFFAVLGARPEIGRFFHDDEDVEADPRPVVVLTHAFWQRHFLGDPGVVGRTLRLNHTPFVVVGVAEAGFSGITLVGTDLWMPMAMAGVARGEPAPQLLADPASTWHIAVGRLAPGVDRAAAEAELNGLLAGFRSATPAIPDEYGIVVAASGRLPTPVRARFGSFLAFLLALAAGLLAIACSNVAGMLLVRATTRYREMATRLALGASRSQLVRMMVVETLVLFLAAAVMALPLSYWLLRAFEALLPAMPIPVDLDLRMSVRTLVFAGGIALAAGLMFGLAPARHAVRADLSPLLHGRASTDAHNRLRLRHGLLVLQVALSMILVFTAGLFTRALQEAASIDTGFVTADVDIVSLDTTVAGLAASHAVPLIADVAARVATVPGVEAVAYARMIPLVTGGFAQGRVRLPGQDDEQNAAFRYAQWDVVSPDYFRTMRLPLVAGRAFTDADRAGRPLVAIVNETFAARAWPGQTAVGRHFIQVQDTEQQVEVVGVARDARYQVIDESSKPFVYVPFAQQPQTHVELFIRHTPGHDVATDVRRMIGVAAPDLPVVSAQRFEDAVAGGVFPQRLAAWTAGLVGVVGVFLAGLGVYGMVAFMVAQRTREIAIRLALGALPRHVRWLVLHRVVRLAGIGAMAGLGLAVAVGRLLQNAGMLFGVPASDAATLSGVGLVAAAVVATACYWPARRAASTDPAHALRGD